MLTLPHWRILISEEDGKGVTALKQQASSIVKIKFCSHSLSVAKALIPGLTVGSKVWLRVYRVAFSKWSIQIRLTTSATWYELVMREDVEGAELLRQVLSVMPETVRILSDALFPNVSWTVSSASLTVF